MTTPTVGVLVAAGKALVGRIEEREQPARAHGAQDAGPLLGRGVDARRVVRARVQDDGRAGRGRVEVGQQALRDKEGAALVATGGAAQRSLCVFGAR